MKEGWKHVYTNYSHKRDEWRYQTIVDNYWGTYMRFHVQLVRRKGVWVTRCGAEGWHEIQAANPAEAKAIAYTLRRMLQ